MSNLVSISVDATLSYPFNQVLPTLVVTGTFSDGSSRQINGDANYPLVFVSSNLAVAKFIDNRGTMNFLRSGASTLTVSQGQLSATSALTVQPIVVGVTISGPARVYLGATQQFHALAVNDDGTTTDVTSQAVWAPTVAGLFSASAPGTTLLSVTYNGFSAKRAVVVPYFLGTTSAGVAPVAAGNKQQITLTNKYSDGSTVDLTSTASWISTNANVATVASGLVSGLTPGTTDIVAVQNGQTVFTVTYTVLPAELQSITVTGPTSVVVGGQVQLTAKGVYSTGASTDISGLVAWNASNPASIISLSGSVTGQKPGLAILVATYQGVQGSFHIDVFPAPDPNLQPQFRSHLTQVVQNYFDPRDARLRHAKYSIDAQLLNVIAQQLEVSDFKADREIAANVLGRCPANVDNRGVYFAQQLPASFDYDLSHSLTAQVNGSATSLVPYDDTLPVPSRVELNPAFSPVPLTAVVLFSLTGIGTANSNQYATQRVTSVTLPFAGKLRFWLTGTFYGNLAVKVRITGFRSPAPVWADRQIPVSEIVSITEMGSAASLFGWAAVHQVQVMNLPEGVTIAAGVGEYVCGKKRDVARPYTNSTDRGFTYSRYWSFQSGLLREEYLSSSYEGYRLIQAYTLSSADAIAIEPNTYGIFVAQGTTLMYGDRREPLPSNLSAAALTVEPLYGLRVQIDEIQSGPVVYVNLQPITYAGNGVQYRYILRTPSGLQYVLTPDGVLATLTSSAGWRRGDPIPLTIPLAETGTYVITLQSMDSSGTITADAVPYGNFAFQPKATLDLSSVVPYISGLSFDERGRLWVWSGSYAVALKFHYDAYVIDEASQAVYLTDTVESLAVDGVSLT